MATIKDVAKKAGVSTATVSYVINESRFVSEDLTRRVREAISELGFHPSRVARSLRRGRTGALGLVMDDITNRLAAEFTKGLESVAIPKGYTILFHDLREDPANEPRALALLQDQRVEGIVYAGYGAAAEELERLHRGGLPVVIVDKPLPSGALPSVLIDNKAATAAALTHLRRIGRTEVLFVNGLRINRNGVLRAEAFREFMERHRLPCGDGSILWGDYTLEHGFRSVRALLAAKRRFNALLCGDDTVAFGAIAALKAGGIRVPEQVAVVGFDDDPLAAVFDPSLTTIHYPMLEMGRSAFQVLARQIGRKRPGAEQVQLATRLVVRRSTDPAYRDYQQLGAGE